MTGLSALAAGGVWGQVLGTTTTPPPNPTGYVRPSGAGYVTYESLWESGDSLWDVCRKVTGGKVLTLPSDLFTVSNFTKGEAYGLALGPASGAASATGCIGIAGSGKDLTAIELVEGSSTQDAWLSGLTNGYTTGTNPATIIAVLGAPSGVEFAGFTLYGSAQGHSYNGIRVGSSPDALVHDLRLVGASPGTDRVPPEETFGINGYLSDRLIIADCEIDGRDSKTGARVCSSPIGFNGNLSQFLTGSRVYRTYCHHGYTGMPTYYRCADIYTEDLTLLANSVGGTNAAGKAISVPGLNHEQSAAGTSIEHVRLTVRKWGRWEFLKGNTDPDVSEFDIGLHVSHNSTLGDSVMRITNPIHDRGPHSSGAMTLFIDDVYVDPVLRTGAQTITTMPVITKNGQVLTVVNATNPGPGVTADTHAIRHF